MARLLPWLLPLLVAVLGLSRLDVPVDSMARYAAYFALCVVLPGVLLLRGFWRSTGNWAEDVGLGAVVGTTYQLAGWAIFTALGWQRFLVIWPALVLVLFAAVPGWRRHWRIAAPKPLPLAWTWGMVVAATVLVGGATVGVMTYHPMPPEGSAYYPDLLYHLSMVNELTRAVPPELPQVAGLSLDYHWFANADMAAAVDITKLSPILVLYRLWLLPLVVVALLVFATLARTVSRAWWTGPLVAAAFAGPQLVLFVDTSVDLAPPLSLLSPSQTFGMIAGTVAAVFLIELLFRDAKGLWLPALAVAIVGGGSKPTILPILVGAVGLAGLYLLVRDRRLPRRVIAAGVLLLAAGVGTMVTVAGSTSGSRIQLLAIIKLQAGYHAATGDRTQAAAGGWILPALSSGKLLSILGAFVIVGLTLVGHAVAAAGYGLLARRDTRSDPVGWFLLGGLVAGWVGYLLVDHPSASESYFVRSVVPFSLAAVGWIAAAILRERNKATRDEVTPAATRDELRGSNRRDVGVVAVVAAGLGGVFGLLLLATRARPRGDQLERILLVARPLIAVALLAVVLFIAWRLLRNRWPRLGGLGVVLALLTVLAVPAASALMYGVRARSSAQSTTFSSKAWQVYPDEARAALWLAENSAPTDVVASNTYCRPAGPQLPGCDARGYIVSGIAGRRTLIEGWGYTQQAMSQQGVDGIRYTRQPSPWPDRVALTNQAISAPTPQVLRRLRDEYGVRWLFADRRDGPVSPELDRLATLRHNQDQIRIYELTR